MLTRLIRNFSSNLKNFDSLQKLNSHLRSTQPAQCVVYFRANWNPQCKQSDQQIVKFANTYPGIQVIKVDTDVAPKIANHYRVKAQPEFVFCLYGDEAIRHIGINYARLEEKVKMVQKLAQHPQFMNLTQKWVEYGQKYRTYYKTTIDARYKQLVLDV